MRGCQVFKPPTPLILPGKKSVFLAGTIDNGNSEDWQTRVVKELRDFDVTILNPRRDEWDSSWEQRIDNPIFKQQVEWELDGMEQADIVFMYFAPHSQSPITLLELGLLARSGKLIVVAPVGFWRKGNVEVVANRYNFLFLENIEDGLVVLKQGLN